jgi:hypothetical protein
VKGTEKLSQAEAEDLVASIDAQQGGNRTGEWKVRPADTAAFSLGWIVVVAPAEGRGYGLGPYFVTHQGDVFATGSGHPAEAYAEDVVAMQRATWNPLRYLRYAARRALDGRTPRRVR